MKIYVEQITEQMGLPPYNNSYIGGIYKDIHTFERRKNEIWNGRCKWKLSQTFIGEKGLDFRTYFMTLRDKNGFSQYFIIIQGYEIKE